MSQRFPNIAEKTHEYTYQYYGIMWGIIFTSVIAVPIILLFEIKAIIYFIYLPEGAILLSAPYHVITLLSLGILIEV